MKRDAVYYLIRDLLDSFSAVTGRSLVSVLNRHFISKEAIRLAFKDEVNIKEPQYSILRGVLIVQNNFLRQFPQSAFYEVIDILPELKYCLKKDTRKTIRKLSAQVILRLFASIYFELRMLPMYHKEDEIYIKKFSSYFSKKDMIEIMNNDEFLTRFIFEQGMISLGTMEEMRIKIHAILNKFYYNHI